MHLPGVLDDITWRLLCTFGLFLVTLLFKVGCYNISHRWSNSKGYFHLGSWESRSIPGLVLDIKCTIPWIYNIYRNFKVEHYLRQHYNNAVSYYPALFKAKCLIAIRYIVWLLLLTQCITTGSNAMSIRAGGSMLGTGMNRLRTDRVFHEDNHCKGTVNINQGISSGSHYQRKQFHPSFLSYSTPPGFTGPLGTNVDNLNSILHKDALEPLYSLGDPSSQGYTGDDLYTTDAVTTNLSETTHSIGIPQSKLKPKPIPFNVDAPLENQPLPPWAYEFVTGVSDPKEEYVPRHYTEQEIQEHFRKVNEETRKRAVTTRLDETTGEPPKSYGFKFKQIQPLRHHNGKSFTFYYVHSLHTNVIPVLLNSLRRVAKRHLGAGRITALRIPGMKNEFYSIVGLREDFFDLSRNLTKVIFRNVPMTATFHRPLIGRLRLKGPIIAVAGHIELDQTFQKEGVGSSSGSKDDRGIEIVNKNQYICALSRDAYLDMEVKIEYIANYVMPEKGPESLNRDITPDGFIHFSSSCTPIEVFAFDGDRRGIDEESTSEIVTLELHTDGSTTPRLALLNCATFIETWFERTYKAFRRDCTRDLDALHEEMASVSTAERLSPELYRNSPYNPYRKPEDKMPAMYSWFYRHDVKRQYPIDPDSRLAKREQLEEWNRHVDDEIAKMENTLPYQPDDRTVKPDRYLSFEETAEKAGFNSPMWIFHDPLGKGMLSNSPVFEFDKEDDPMSFPIE